MNYEQWRDELFEHPPNINPRFQEHSTEFYEVPPCQAFDYVDRVLLDQDIHSMFSKDQLGNGINTIYAPGCSDLPRLYTSECDEDRRIKGIGNLVNLYRNYFERYCTAPIVSIDNYKADGEMGLICYMFWDDFDLYPGIATPAMTSAAVNTMEIALDSSNDNCLVSAIHGLGHWAFDVPEAITVLKQWLRRPTTKNREVLQYARTAITGMIL